MKLLFDLGRYNFLTVCHYWTWCIHTKKQRLTKQSVSFVGSASLLGNSLGYRATVPIHLYYPLPWISEHDQAKNCYSPKSCVKCTVCTLLSWQIFSGFVSWAMACKGKCLRVISVSWLLNKLLFFSRIKFSSCQGKNKWSC